MALVIKQHEIIESQAAIIERQERRIAELESIVQSQAERISVLEEEISKLSGPKSKPTFVKANVPKKENGPRKKRTQSFARKSRVATEVICHALECCPDCGRKLIGGTVKQIEAGLRVGAVGIGGALLESEECAVARGSETNSILRSLFETWALQGGSAVASCRQMIIDANTKMLAGSQ